MAASLADIAAHVLEQYMTSPGQSRPMDRWAEGLLLTVIDIAPMLVEGRADDAALADYMLTATLALNNMIAMGVSEDWATHSIGHELTAFTGMAHGATLAIPYPALLRVLTEEKEAKLVQFGERVFGITEGSARERALAEAGVGEEVDRRIAERFRERGWKLGENRTILPDDVARILAAARPAKR